MDAARDYHTKWSSKSEIERQTLYDKGPQPPGCGLVPPARSAAALD